MVRPEELNVGDIVRSARFGYGRRRNDGIIEVGYEPDMADSYDHERAAATFKVLQKEKFTSPSSGVHDRSVDGVKVVAVRCNGFVPAEDGERIEFYGGWFTHTSNEVERVSSYRFLNMD